jgi:hypothetical protein
MTMNTEEILRLIEAHNAALKAREKHHPWTPRQRAAGQVIFFVGAPLTLLGFIWLALISLAAEGPVMMTFGTLMLVGLICVIMAALVNP